MADPLDIAASGLDAANAMAAVYANNLATMDTPDFAPREADLLAAPDGAGVIVDIVTLDSPTVVQGSGDSGIDPVAQAMQFRRAQALYDANAQVIVASQQMFGSLLDMLDTERTAPPAEDDDNVL